VRCDPVWANGPTCYSQGRQPLDPSAPKKHFPKAPTGRPAREPHTIKNFLANWLTNSLDRARHFWHTRPQPTRPEDLQGFNGRVVTCHGHGSSAPVRSKRRLCLSRSLAPGPASTSPSKLSGRARPGQWARRAECWRRGIDGGPFGWKPGPGDSSVDANECHSWQMLAS
jgi:hypothetical protein